MKKILTTIVIMTMILYTSSVLGYIGIEKVYDQDCKDFREQIYQNYYYRNNVYNTNNTSNKWKNDKYYDEETTILDINGNLYYYYKNNIYLYFNSIGNTEKVFFQTSYKGVASTTSSLINKNNILYSPLTFFKDSTGEEIRYRTGSINIPTMYITSENDGGLVIYYPQNDEIKNTKKILELIIRKYKDNTIVKSINLDLYNNTYENNLTDNRFWTFTGEEVNEFLKLSEGYYYLQLKYHIVEDAENITSSIVSASPYFCLNENGIETPGGDTGTETPGENNKNDYITNAPDFDENGELAEEQTRTSRKYTKRF